MKKTSTACTVVRGDSGMDVNEKCHDKINKDTHENQSKFQEPKHWVVLGQLGKQPWSVLYDFCMANCLPWMDKVPDPCLNEVVDGKVHKVSNIQLTLMLRESMCFVIIWWGWNENKQLCQCMNNAASWFNRELTTERRTFVQIVAHLCGKGNS